MPRLGSPKSAGGMVFFKPLLRSSQLRVTTIRLQLFEKWQKSPFPYGSDRDNADNGFISCMRKHVFRVIFIYFYLFYPLFFYFLGQFILIFTSTLTLEIKGDTGWQKSKRKNSFTPSLHSPSAWF